MVAVCTPIYKLSIWQAKQWKMLANETARLKLKCFVFTHQWLIKTPRANKNCLVWSIRVAPSHSPVISIWRYQYKNVLCPNTHSYTADISNLCLFAIVLHLFKLSTPATIKKTAVRPCHQSEYNHSTTIIWWSIHPSGKINLVFDWALLAN